MRHTLDLLKTLAASNDPVARVRIASCIRYRGRIVAFGWNKKKTHPLAKEYSKNDEAIFLHAEADVIIKARKLLTPKELSKSTIFVARHKKCSHFGTATPCSGCRRLILDSGIKTIVSTLEGYKYQVETIE